MENPEEYAKLIRKADPDFVEVKAYMYVGSSRKRLTLDNMPSFDEVKEFAKKILFSPQRVMNCGKSKIKETGGEIVCSLRSYPEFNLKGRISPEKEQSGGSARQKSRLTVSKMICKWQQ